MRRVEIFLSLLIFFIIPVFAKDYKPFLKIDVKANAKDIVLGDNNQLVIGTDSSKLLVYDYDKKEFVKSIEIPKIKDFMGDTIDARVSSVDYLNGKYLLLSDSGIGGYADLRLHENNKTIDIFTEKDKLPIIKARFVDNDTILLGFLSNEVALYSLKDKKMIYRKQLNQSKFSDFALNEDKSLAVFSCESGENSLIETKTGKIIKVLKGLNVDNVYKIDIKKNIVACAGQDRRGSWYNIKSGKGDYIEGKFLIYATALSPDAKLIAFPLDEQNNIYIYNISTKSRIAILKGQKSTLNTIIFKDNSTIFSASDDNIVIMWKLN